MRMHRFINERHRNEKNNNWNEAYGENNVSVIGIASLILPAVVLINVSPPVANVRGIEAERPACQMRNRVRRGDC